MTTSAELIQGSPEWHRARTGKITGSRVGAILGVDPYNSPKSIMRQMVREALELPSEIEENDAMRHGTAHEPIAVSIYEQITLQKVTHRGLVPHPKYDFIAYSPDGIVEEEGLFIEVKCPLFGSYKRLDEKPGYAAQIALGHEVLGINHAHFIIYRAHDITIEDVYEDEGWFPRSLPTLLEFYEEYKSIIKSKTKSKEYREPAIKVMRDLHWEKLAKQYKDATAQIAALEEDAARIKQEMIRRAEGNSCEGAGIQLLKIERKGAVDYKKVINDFDIQYDESKYKADDTSYWSVKIDKEKP